MLHFSSGLDAVCRNKLLRGVTQAEVAGIVKVWLRNSGDRDGGRGKRMKTSSSPAEPRVSSLVETVARSCGSLKRSASTSQPHVPSDSDDE